MMPTLERLQRVGRLPRLDCDSPNLFARGRKQPERTDSDIAGAAVDALMWKSSVPADRVRVLVKNGWVTLEGQVDWQYQKDAAFGAVDHLVGVKGVTNMIALRPRVSATEVKSRIEAAFRRSAELDAQKVRVEIEGLGGIENTVVAG